MIELSFEEACRDFGDFLESQGMSRSVGWVFRDGVSGYRRRWLVDGSVADADGLQAATLYDQGCRKGLGVCIQAISEVEGTTYAYLLIPEDEADQSSRMMSDTLRYAVQTAAELVIVQRPLAFRVMRWRDRLRGASPFLDEVPHRPESFSGEGMLRNARRAGKGEAGR